MFTSVPREAGLTERTRRQMQELIVSGTLRAGDRLPPEKKLVEQLGVSKTVVREAVRSLAARGLIDVRPGSGMYVMDITANLMSEPMDLIVRSRHLTVENIHEVREVLEIKIAALAAERASAADLAALEESIRRLDDAGLTAVEYAQLDVEFHSRLAAAANPLFSILINSINDVMLEVRLQAFKLGRQKFVREAVQQHTKILKYVKRQDAGGAQRAMTEHLMYGRANLLRAAKLTSSSLSPAPRRGGGRSKLKGK